MAWTLAQAKEHLEEIVARAANDGPQVVEIDGQPRGVIVTLEQWRTGRAHPVDWADTEDEEPVPGFKELLVSLGSV